MDLTHALAPKSDQLDFADLEGMAPQVFTITKVSENGSELADQQPVNVSLKEFPRVWRPSKGMLRVMADAWGKDVSVWVGRQVELYGDPNVYFGKEKRGGTRISRLSHISKRQTTLINPRGGRGAYWSVDPLPAQQEQPPQPPEPTAEQVAACDDFETLRRMHAVSGPERRQQIEQRVADLSDEPEPETEGGAA